MPVPLRSSRSVQKRLPHKGLIENFRRYKWIGFALLPRQTRRNIIGTMLAPYSGTNNQKLADFLRKENVRLSFLFCYKWTWLPAPGSRVDCGAPPKDRSPEG